MSLPELRDVITAAMLLVAMVLAGLIGRRQRIGIALLALLSLVWLTVDRLWEGPVLVAVSKHNGLVTSDFVGLAGLGAAIWLYRRFDR
jgi:hypothetical protein